MLNKLCKPLVIILRYIVLWMMKREFRKYERDAKYCHINNITPDLDKELKAIELQKEILMLETTIEIERG